jgi:hypothetical protein
MEDALEFIMLWIASTILCALFTVLVKKISDIFKMNWLTEMHLKYPNDADLGSEIRKLVQKQLEK